MPHSAPAASKAVHRCINRTHRAADQRLAEVGILATPLAYHQPVLPGRGEIDWARFIAELNAIGYDGRVCVEVEDRAFEADLAGRQEALRRAHTVLSPLITAQVPRHQTGQGAG